MEWSRHSEFHLVTASYDGTVKLWDTRGSVPLGTSEAHHDKVLCADWISDVAFVSGGADNKIQIHTGG